MRVIGLTGGIGAGKGEVAAVWKKQGATILTADTYGHTVLETNAQVRRQLRRAFGNDVISKSGRADRATIAQRAFASPDAARALNRIVGKPLVRLLHADVSRLRRRQEGVLVVDAALLCEWRSNIAFDLRGLAWLSKRGISARSALQRMKMQWPDRRKRTWADLEICNDGTLKQLRAKALDAWYGAVQSGWSSR
jgi:dephospho-CoA kinase